ncbi:polysaccharide pyruvyl transferase family protein [Candidatus Peregrinibacteria bacterium]|nr:polysaccharide pyruvyl transferase family protein [Candidatus Peregrinibacteria bacterium]
MKIAVAGNYGANNLGDEMILEGLLETLLNIFPNAEIAVLSANPADTEERHNVRSVHRFPSGFRSFLKGFFNRDERKKTIEAVKNCDFFVLGGGGLFGELSFKGNFIWATQALKAARYGKPIIMYGQSIGPIRNRFFRWFIKRLFQKAALITVRDEASKERLKEWGIHKKIYLIPDIAFRKHRGLKSAMRQQEMVIALRYLKNLPSNFVEKIAGFLNWLVSEQKYCLHFIDLFPKDEIFYNKIAQFLPQNALKHSSPKSSPELLDIIHNADFVLGMRLHSIIAAIQASTPFIAINYSSKIHDLLEHTDFKNWLIGMDLEKIQEKFLNIRTESAKIKGFSRSLHDKHIQMESIIKKELINLCHGSIRRAKGRLGSPRQRS